ncbi:MAG TPA: PAS domain S-box protein, partial [Nitrospiraceae bacterium]|nr:PAS domain S-box protein [Nitrospiraceae bacterium]
AAAKAGGMGTFHGFCPTMQGEAKWWDVAVTPMFDARGEVERLLSVSRDITERKAIEDALRDSEERLRSLVQSTKDAIVSINSQGAVVFWNKGAEDIFGYRSEEMMGKPVARIIPERFQEAHRRGVMRASQAGRLTRPGEMVELVGLRKNGAEFPLEFTLASWRTKEGVFFTGIIRDVTDRKREEEERQKLAKDRLLLLESTGEGIYGMDRQGRCTFINKAAAKMFGYHPDEVLGKDMHQLIHHSFADGSAFPPARCRIYEAFISGKGGQVEDEVFWRKDGTSFPVAYSSFPVLEQGEITGAVVIFVDCTARKRLEEERSRRAGRLLRQQSALTGLTQSRLFQSSLLMSTLQHITALAASTLNVERVSIWRYTEDRDAIHCVDLFELSRDRHVAGMTLPVTSHPVYFQTLAASQIIAADDARTDKRTAEFSPHYLSQAGITSMMDVPIYLFGRLEGVICHEHVGPPRRWTEDEQMFAVAVSNLVALAYEQGERRRAEEQLQQSQDRLRSLTARLESVREDERIRIAREIHDELGQALTGVKLELSLLRDQMPEGRPALLATLESIAKLVDTTIQSVRRIATELRPVVLDQLGLIPAIEWQAREFQSRTAIQCTLDIYLRSVSLSQAGSTAMFRIFQEILTNVARHARASAVNITLQEQAGALVLEVRDNGRGVTDAELADPKSLGLVGMRERALLLGGATAITGIPGKGTTVKVRIPLDQIVHDGS